MNDCSNVSDASKRSRCKHLLDVCVLSPEERAYLLGLYFADGWIKVRRKSKSTTLSFGLQGNEVEIAGRVVGLLRRAGLNPHITFFKGGEYAMEVFASATNIVSFFAAKRGVCSFDGHVGLEWMSGVGGLEVPFIAGLLDGDGYLYAEFLGGGSKRRSMRRASIFGTLDARWSFAQRKFSFLADFTYGYVNSLVRGGATCLEEVGGTRRVLFTKSGREALIRCGVVKWSWKVADWLRKVELVKKDISDLKSRFLTPSRAACRLRLGQSTVGVWCSKGLIRHLKIRSATSRKSGPWRCLIPLEEVERLEAELSAREGEKEGPSWSTQVSMKAADAAGMLGVDETELMRWRHRGTVGKADAEYVIIADAARILSVPSPTVYDWCRYGKIRCVMVCGRNGKFFLIPRDEVQRHMCRQKSRL